MGETLTDSADAAKQAEFWMKTTVVGDEWDDKTAVMTWFEFEDPASPGELIGASCTAEFRRKKSFATKVYVTNTKGPKSYGDVAKKGQNVKWSDVLKDQKVSDGIFYKDDKDEKDFFKTSFKNDDAS